MFLKDKSKKRQRKFFMRLFKKCLVISEKELTLM